MIDEFLEIIRDPNRIPSPEMVEGMYARYPFFPLPAALMLQRCGDTLCDDVRGRLMQRVALGAGNFPVLANLISDYGRNFSTLYPDDKPVTPATEDAIDTFLDRYCNVDPAETAVLERLIFNPVPADYMESRERDGGPDDAAAAAALPGNEESEATADAAPEPDSIESMLAAVREIASLGQAGEAASVAESESGSGEAEPEARQARHKAPMPGADTTFSESLAKIYIKQQRFDKALEIISGLNLKYPEKSVYFADQIRFLQKLILNRSYNSQQ